jgi:hypothetical protein
MKKFLGIVALSLLSCSISIASSSGGSAAKNLSDIIGNKKKAAHYHNCKVTDSSKGKDTNYEFGIVYAKSEGIKGDHFVISYNKKTKKYELPISANLYFKEKIENQNFDVMIHFSLSTPEFRKDLGVAIGMNIVMSSFVLGNQSILLRYWFGANSHKINDKFLYEELVDILTSEDKIILDKKLIKFTNEIFKITSSHLKLSKPFSLSEFDAKIINKIELDKNLKDNRLLDWTTYDCKTKFAKD